MKKIFLIYIILSYTVFAQVYPFVHKHAGHNHFDIDLSLVLPDEGISACSHDHPNEDQHSHSHEHAYHDFHFLADWDYTNQSTVLTHAAELQAEVDFEIQFDELTEQITVPLDIPLKLPPSCLVKILPDRAPPQSS